MFPVPHVNVRGGDRRKAVSDGVEIDHLLHLGIDIHVLVAHLLPGASILERDLSLPLFVSSRGFGVAQLLFNMLMNAVQQRDAKKHQSPGLLLNGNRSSDATAKKL